jgi:hypothetical protein
VVRRLVRSYFADRRRERRREQVQDWKEAGVYTYEGDPVNEPEQAERVVFDVVSGALVPHISKGNRPERGSPWHFFVTRSVTTRTSKQSGKYLPNGKAHSTF